MKKYYYILALITLILSSCDIQSDGTRPFRLEVMPITNVVVPEEFVLGNTYEISVSYTKPSDCYEFNDFLYTVEGAERSIAVVNTVYTAGSSCSADPSTAIADFDFTVSSTETHIFKFFQGTNDEGVDQYHIVEVPVVEGD